jgi:SpoVK/Ycf46/Vps4 family AAA+-type ATPase
VSLVVVKNPSDFVGGALGQSEQQTKGILAATLGKVLVIDEAYGLYGGGGNQGASSDPYKTAVIDTIVAEVQSVPGDDRCVLLLGYKDQMEKMFQNVNPGLSRRFPIASGFVFEDFSDDELRKIFNLKVKSQGYQTTESGTNVAMEILKRARNRPNFGNAGEVDILLNDAKARHQKRFSKGEASSADLLEPLDFDEDCDRAERAETNIRSLFEGTVGCEQAVSLLQGYQDTARTLRALGMDPKQNTPFNFLFRGPPGTGKTTTAKKMGQVFYDMGFLATSEVVECSATDLIGQYVGQTGPKVQQLLDKALGKVLFVDEAYRLAEGHFAKEAMDELVDLVTKERYFKKLIIILAGYEADINRLMSVNSGLTSRFPATVNFRALTADECISLMLQLLTTQKDALKAKGKELDLTCLERPTEQFRRVLLGEFTKLGAQQSWASARDVQELARASFNRVLGDKEGLARGVLALNENAIVEELQAMWKERESRASSAKPATLDLGDIFQLQNAPTPCAAGPPKMSTAISTTQATAKDPEDGDESPGEPQQPVQDAAMRAEIDNGYRPRHAQRDAGVSDEVWEQLQRDRQAEEEREEEYRRLQETARKATADAREKIVTRLLEEKKRREMEEAAKKKLMEMCACPAGFNWIKQKGGYRCTGGSHWMSDAQLGFKE